PAAPRDLPPFPTRRSSDLHRYDVRRFMMLDDSARRNLELTANLRDGKRQGSLLWLLDRTATAMGSRLLKKWLDKPLLDLKAIRSDRKSTRLNSSHVKISYA